MEHVDQLSPLVVRIVGLLYILLSSLFLFINGILFVTLWKSKELQTATYRIVRCICLACIVQLTVQLVGGIITFTDMIEDHVNKILGAVLQSGWFLYIGLSLSLAVDRLLCFVIISPKKCSRISIVVLSAAWILAFAYLVAFLLPDFDFGYCCSHQFLHWFYTEEAGALILKKTEVIIDFVILALIFLLYCIIFGFLIKMRKIGRTKAEAQSLKVEFRILIVAMISFAYEMTYLLWFFFGVSLMPHSPYRDVITTLWWIVDSGFFAISTLFFNSSIKRHVKTLMVMSRSTRVSKF